MTHEVKRSKVNVISPRNTWMPRTKWWKLSTRHVNYWWCKLWKRKKSSFNSTCTKLARISQLYTQWC